MARSPSIVGDVVFGNAASPIAVCTLSSRGMLAGLAGRAEIAIAGRVFTENIGIEQMVANLARYSTIRCLIVCGRESSHRVGETILKLHEDGIDTARRVVGSSAPDPVLPNLDAAHLAHFRSSVVVVDMIGETDPSVVVGRAAREARRLANPADGGDLTNAADAVERIRARVDAEDEWEPDPLGYLVIRVDHADRAIVVDHHATGHRLLRRIVGTHARELCDTLVRVDAISTLGHALYAGRELARAETALRSGQRYEQGVAVGGQGDSLG
ncbi:MAG: hypothetical protein U0821_03095 [Chloroflexota bacterium]